MMVYDLLNYEKWIIQLTILKIHTVHMMLTDTITGIIPDSIMAKASDTLADIEDNVADNVADNQPTMNI